MPTFFGLYAKFYWQVCQNSTLRVTGLFSWEATSLIKNIFQIVFHNLGGNFSGFWQIFSSTVVRTAYVPRFFSRTYANFSRTLRKFLLANLSELQSTCPHDCFHGKHLLRKKNAFQFVFQIFGGNFSGFRQNLSSTVIRTALVSRFFNRNDANFFGVHAKV